MSGFAIMAVAMLVDAALGWPDRLYRRVGHPVTWLGRLISVLEMRLNHGSLRRAKGVLTAVLVIGVSGGLGFALTVLATKTVSIPAIYLAIQAIFAWPLIATRSLHDHVRAVEQPLAQGDLAGARHAVSMIVGRDPSALDEAGVARAALESLAENTSDGITAPLFWGALLGLPGIFAYKAINTLDSMIGHRNARYEQFGWASARIDDVVNLAPARLTGLFFALVSRRPLTALRCMAQDARHHRSPNAGWPEAAMAGALGLRLSGPRAYHGVMSQERWVNPAGIDPVSADLSRGLALYRRAMLAVAALLFIMVI